MVQPFSLILSLKIKLNTQLVIISVQRRLVQYNAESVGPAQNDSRNLLVRGGFSTVMSPAMTSSMPSIYSDPNEDRFEEKQSDEHQTKCGLVASSQSQP